MFILHGHWIENSPWRQQKHAFQIIIIVKNKRGYANAIIKLMSVTATAWDRKHLLYTNQMKNACWSKRWTELQWKNESVLYAFCFHSHANKHHVINIIAFMSHFFFFFLLNHSCKKRRISSHTLWFLLYSSTKIFTAYTETAKLLLDHKQMFNERAAYLREWFFFNRKEKLLTCHITNHVKCYKLQETHVHSCSTAAGLHRPSVLENTVLEKLSPNSQQAHLKIDKLDWKSIMKINMCHGSDNPSVINIM